MGRVICSTLLKTKQTAKTDTYGRKSSTLVTINRLATSTHKLMSLKTPEENLIFE